MADLSFTKIEVLGNVSLKDRISSSAVFNVGDVMFLSGSQYLQSIASDDTTLNAVGIALGSGGINEYPVLIPSGARIRLVGATMTKGVVYYLSENAGKIAPLADIVNVGSVIIPVLIAESATEAYILLTRPAVDIVV